MSVTETQVWFPLPNIQSFVPNFDFLTVERIHQTAIATLQNGLFIAGLLQGGFAIADLRDNRAIPAAVHAGTSVFCFWAYSAIEEFKAKIALLETITSQMQELRRNNQELRGQIEELSNISNALGTHSTALEGLEGRINTILTQSTKFTDTQKDLIRSCFTDAKNKLIEELVKALSKAVNEMKDELMKTFKKNEKQTESLTLQYNQISRERSQLEFLTGIVPRVLSVVESNVIYRNLSEDDQRRLFALRQFYEANVPLNNQLNQPR